VTTKILRSLRWFFSLCLLLVFVSGLAIYLTLLADLPAVTQIELHQARPTTQILDRNGRLLYELIDQDAGKQIDLRLDSVPQACINATCRKPASTPPLPQKTVASTSTSGLICAPLPARFGKTPVPVEKSLVVAAPLPSNCPYPAIGAHSAS